MSVRTVVDNYCLCAGFKRNAIISPTLSGWITHSASVKRPRLALASQWSTMILCLGDTGKTCGDSTLLAKCCIVPEQIHKLGSCELYLREYASWFCNVQKEQSK